MVKDEDLEELAHSKFWDERYASKHKLDDNGKPVLDSFEWFRDFKKLRPFLETHLPVPNTACHVLHLGCGNSTLTADLDGLGYKNQTSVDFSQVVIESMRSKYAALETQWEVMDVRDLKMHDGSIDVAIDKGTLDAMIHGSLWDPPEDVRSNVGQYVDEVARVLKPGGQWIYITYRQPHFMKPLLLRDELWDLSVEIIQDPDGGGGFEYFGFIMKRKISGI